MANPKRLSICEHFSRVACWLGPSSFPPPKKAGVPTTRSAAIGFAAKQGGAKSRAEGAPIALAHTEEAQPTAAAPARAPSASAAPERAPSASAAPERAPSISDASFPGPPPLVRSHPLIAVDESQPTVTSPPAHAPSASDAPARPLTIFDVIFPGPPPEVDFLPPYECETPGRSGRTTPSGTALDKSEGNWF